ncbi:MAG: histidine--tRNA ligase [Candidatus Omnitrophota bacterium]
MIKRLKGTEDILPDVITTWRQVEEASRSIFSLYCYKEIRTPIIEESSLFMRSVGEDTDIVKKQMYLFNDQGGHSICLRPEETASVVRAYIENNIDKKDGFLKLFYMGPMFRSERPQAGRLRQFHQIGVEAIGSYSPYLDAEVIMLLTRLLESYRLKDYTVIINSLGCDTDKNNIKKRLREELRYSLNTLCEDCKRRYESNILRILDCKNPFCRKALDSVSIDGILCKDCGRDFKMLQDILDDMGVSYEVSPLLVRGLDYYTKVVFEVTAKHLGAQNAIAAGGRYDNLISDFGGQKTGACGFAIGVERVIELLSKLDNEKLKDEKRHSVFIATLGDEAKRQGFRLLNELRVSGLAAEIDYQAKSLKSQMRYADKIKARYVIMLGENELKKGKAIVKDMTDSSQCTVALDRLVEELKSLKV